MALDLINWNQWRITSADPEVVINLEGQFPPEGGIRIRKDPATSAAAAPGADAPVVQWVHGGSELAEIRSAFYAVDVLRDITPQIEALELMRSRDANLGRGPKVTLEWGAYSLTGFAKVDYQISGWWDVSGYPKAVLFTLSIIEAPDLDYEDSGTGSGETQWVTLGASESLEYLAWRLLRDPLKGELIRRENPEIAAAPAVGDRVKVLEKEHPRMRPRRVSPSSPPFADPTAKRDTLRAVLSELGADRGTNTGGLVWDNLPAVLSGEVS